MRVILFTRSAPRHLWVSAFLGAWFDVRQVVEDGAPVAAGGKWQERHAKAWAAHELEAFGAFEGAMGRSVLPEKASASCIDALESDGWKADAICAFGSSILGRDILDRFPGRALNLHMGLSPWYRGSATNVWPMLDGCPQYIGATVHHLDEGIDTGAIVSQVRAYRTGDTVHEAGARAIKLGAHELRVALSDIEDGYELSRIEPVMKPGDPERVCKRADFGEAQARALCLDPRSPRLAGKSCAS